MTTRVTDEMSKTATRAFLVRLGSAIRQLRRGQGLRQVELGARIGIAGTRIGEIERGAVNTSVARLCAVAEALGITPGMLLRREELSGEASPGTESLRQGMLAALRTMHARDVDLLAQLLARFGAMQPGA